MIASFLAASSPALCGLPGLNGMGAPRLFAGLWAGTLRQITCQNMLSDGMPENGTNKIFQ